MENQTPKQKQADQYTKVQQQHGAGEMNVENMVETLFIVKNLDDLFLAEQSVQNSLKRTPFNPHLLGRRDKIHHDIAALQPLVAAMGVRFARHIEKKYGMNFQFITGGPQVEGQPTDFEKAIAQAAAAPPADGANPPKIELLK